MQPILINRTASDLRQQLDYLIRQEFFISYKGYKKAFLVLVIATLVCAAILIATPTDSFVTFKVLSIVLAAIAWLAAIIMSISPLIKWIKRIRWRNKVIMSISKVTVEEYLSFDETKISIITDKFKTDVNWEYFKYYAEYKSIIFLFTDTNLYGNPSYSEQEIGVENFLLLKAIVKNKLSPLMTLNN